MNPMNPIMIQDVEVTSVDPALKTFAMIVHITAMPDQMYTPQVQTQVSIQVRNAVKYLVAEGFIPDPLVDDWLCTISGICHPPS